MNIEPGGPEIKSNIFKFNDGTNQVAQVRTFGSVSPHLTPR